MSEDELLTIKWLNSDDSDEWRQKTFARIYRPLLAAIPDGYPSCVMSETVYSLWIAP
jgi:hypothetical protein